MLDEYLAVLCDLKHTLQVFETILEDSRVLTVYSDLKHGTARRQENYLEAKDLIERLKEHYDKGA